VLEVPRVPQDDCGDEEVQARSAVLLVLIGAVADVAEAMDEDSPRQAVARFALVGLVVIPEWAPTGAALDAVVKLKSMPSDRAVSISCGKLKVLMW
jgi:hypothetical protein